MYRFRFDSIVNDMAHLCCLVTPEQALPCLQEPMVTRFSFEKSWEGLLVGSEVGGIDVQSLNGTLAFKVETLDGGEVRVHLGTGVLETVHASSNGLGAW